MRVFLCLLLLAASLRADVSLAPPFGDHVVLQREKPLPIWGRAAPGEHVAVTFRGETRGTTTGTDGRWSVVLDPAPASDEPAELLVVGKNTLHVTDVLVGDVWLCAGEGTMETPVARAPNAADEIARTPLPSIRQLKIQRALSASPADSVAGAWSVCSLQTVGDFGAVGYFFARDLQARLGVPLGLINCSSAGSSIEAWLSPAAVMNDPACADVRTRGAQPASGYEAMAPASLFNGMINPLLPGAMRGVLWSQGESDAVRAGSYRGLFGALIVYWRKHFGQGELPFFWVQLGGTKTGAGDWAALRAAQTVTLALPDTGQIVTIDLPHTDDGRPNSLQEVGRRLALVARAQAYSLTVDCSGPVFTGAKREGAALRIHFLNAGTGLTAAEKPLQSFQVAGADRRFFPAVARIDRDTVLVSAPEVKEPVAVRYAWANSPEANLFNGAGLPATPFRSDDW